MEKEEEKKKKVDKMFFRTINLCWIRFKLNKFITVFKLIYKFHTQFKYSNQTE